VSKPFKFTPPSTTLLSNFLLIFLTSDTLPRHLALSFLYLYIYTHYDSLYSHFFFQGSAFRQQHGDKVPGLSLEEAVELEQQAHVADLERKRRLKERREKQGLVTVKGGALTREEQEARIWAFMCDDPLADLITTNSDSDVSVAFQEL
jgi:hypothetical protein